MPEINVVGLGYIGLPTALMLASEGMAVAGTDCNPMLIDSLKRGKTDFSERGMAELFSKAIKNNIEFSTDYVCADIYIIAVPTPYDKEKKKIDTSYIISAISSVLDVCKDGAIIIIESTLSPGTTDKYIRPCIEKSGKKVSVAHAPERIIPGNMLYELKFNARTIGADNQEIANKVKEIYASFCVGEISVTDIRTAEMTKVVENAYRDINIAFANELAKICRSDNLDVYEIIKIANKHPRVNILNPGPGVGGHCISVDPWFLVGDYPELANIVLTARKINDSMPEFVLERIFSIMREKGIDDIKRVGLYGLTYKENVNDMRESPTLQLLNIMEKNLSVTLKTYDPYIKEDILPNQYHNFDEFLKEIDIIVIMVAHNEIVKNSDKLKGKIVFDTKNIYNGEKSYKL